MPTYEDVNKAEAELSAVEERALRDCWQQVIDGNDSVQDWLEHCSRPEADNFFWLFRQGWLWRHALTAE